jgi:catechol 2,3-dioxygenase-like lactoylglutathione lyase family enzyme
MEGFQVAAAYTSYSVSDFEATRDFYEAGLGCSPVTGWDRADGRGVYYRLGQVPVAEILAAARGEAPLSPPAPGSFSVVLIVGDARRAYAELAARAVTVPTPLTVETWGSYFAVDDPDGVPLYFIEQAPQGG